MRLNSSVMSGNQQERLVLAADADRRRIERELHRGVHQYLVALATTVQLARRAADSDPAAVNALLDDMERDVRRALEETSLLAQRIYPATLELGGLAALLRSAAVQAGAPASVDVSGGSDYAPEVAFTVYLCWLAALASTTADEQVTISVTEADGMLRFELAAGLDAVFDHLQDRVEALGGILTAEPGRLSGSLPLRG
jgi:signal transduction histidine kinase